MNQQSFVYCWTDHLLDKLYIGVHKGSIDDGYVCTSKPMMAEYNIRPQDFSREIIASGSDSDMRELESKLLNQVDAAQSEQYYNQMNTYPEFSMSGREHTDETKRRISKALKGNIRSLGYKHTEESKQKISEAHKGKKHVLGYKHTEESKNKMSKRLKGNKYALGNKSWNKGKKLSEETRKKMSEAKLGKPSNRKGKKHTDNTKKKISEAHKGKKLSEETRKKMSEAKLGNNYAAKKEKENK